VRLRTERLRTVRPRTTRGRPTPGTGAAMCDRAAVLADDRQAPARVRAGGHGLRQRPTVLRAQWPEPGYLPRRPRQAQPGAQRHRQIDHPCHPKAAARIATGSEAGTATGSRA
jgi:hypothetical protein